MKQKVSHFPFDWLVRVEAHAIETLRAPVEIQPL
jgi:hypothetical protein